MPKNTLSVQFDVSTNFDMTVDEATEWLLKAERMLNERSRLRWHLTEVTLKDIKTFVGKEGEDESL